FWARLLFFRFAPSFFVFGSTDRSTKPRARSNMRRRSPARPPGGSGVLSRGLLIFTGSESVIKSTFLCCRLFDKLRDQGLHRLQFSGMRLDIGMHANEIRSHPGSLRHGQWPA